MAIQYDVLSEQDWQKLPLPSSMVTKPNPWAEALDVLEQGGTIVIGYTDVPDLRSKRMSLSHRARSRGLKLEMRRDGTRLAIRRLEDETFQRLPTPAPEPTPVRAKGRKPRATATTRS